MSVCSVCKLVTSTEPASTRPARISASATLATSSRRTRHVQVGDLSSGFNTSVTLATSSRRTRCLPVGDLSSDVIISATLDTLFRQLWRVHYHI